MRNSLLALVSLLLSACVASAPTEQPASSLEETVQPCYPSCIIADKRVEKYVLRPGQGVEFFDAEDDTLRTYIVTLVDGRESILSKEEYSTLNIYDSLPKCSLDPVIACPQ